jgi:hypothetical protein
MYRENGHEKHDRHDQQESTDPRVQARRALQASYDWRDDEPSVGEASNQSSSRREFATATPAPSASWTSTV